MPDELGTPSVSLGGAQAYYNVKPDLTVLGKIIGGGFPAAAFGGQADIMRCIAPLGSVYQAGTLSGNPVAMTAGLATLELLLSPNFYTKLAKHTQSLIEGFSFCAKQFDIPLQTVSIGSMFGFFFTDAEKIESEDDVKKCNSHTFKKFFHAMLEKRIYLAPSAFEIGFVSATHGDLEIKKTIKAAAEVFGEMKTQLTLKTAQQ